MKKNISENAQVSEGARLSDDVRVFGSAQVFGGAWVSSKAQVFGAAQVFGGAWVSGNARVYDTARVSGEARVFDNVLVYGAAQVSGGAWLSNSVTVSGNAQVFGSARICGGAQISGDARIGAMFDYLLVGPIGSRGDFFTVHRDAKIVARLNAGCFSGAIDEFEAKVRDVHGDSAHAREYLNSLLLVRERAKRWGGSGTFAGSASSAVREVVLSRCVVS